MTEIGEFEILEREFIEDNIDSPFPFQPLTIENDLAIEVEEKTATDAVLDNFNITATGEEETREFYWFVCRVQHCRCFCALFFR